MTTSPEPQFLSIKRVAAILAFSEETIWRFVKAGKLPAVKLGSRWRIDRADLRAFTTTRVPEPTQEVPSADDPQS